MLAPISLQTHRKAAFHVINSAELVDVCAGPPDSDVQRFAIRSGIHYMQAWQDMDVALLQSLRHLPDRVDYNVILAEKQCIHRRCSFMNVQESAGPIPHVMYAIYSVQPLQKPILTIRVPVAMFKPRDLIKFLPATGTCTHQNYPH
ncbi:hypothetical protein Aduo_002789 [Ancylostoma duodenale]